MSPRPHQAGVVCLMGFRRKAKKPRPNNVTTMLDDETAEALRREAIKAGDSISVAVEKILRRALIS